MALRSDNSERQTVLSLLMDYPPVRRFSNFLESKQYTNDKVIRFLFFLKKYISLCRQKEEIPFRQVKEMAEHAKRRVGSNYYTGYNDNSKRYLEIRCDGDPQAAFFAQFVYVLQQIKFAEEHQLIPIVNFDHKYNFYFDGNHNSNVWENYFEPVASISSSDLDELPAAEITFLKREQQRALHLGDGDEPPLVYNSETEAWWFRQRQMGARLTKEYVRIKPQIQQFVEQFYNAHFGNSCVLGIHLRGTDKSTRFDGKPFEGAQQFTRIIPPHEYYPWIDLFLQVNPEGKLFVATDQQQFLMDIVARYGKCVIRTGAERSTTCKAVFKRSGSGYDRGIEVLTDTLLLSKCDFLLKCFSNVGEVATYFNPKLPVIDMFYKHRLEDFNCFFNQPKTAS